MTPRPGLTIEQFLDGDWPPHSQLIDGEAELWLVDTPRQTVIMLRRSVAASPIFDVTVELGEAASITSPLLAGFALPV